MLTDIEIAQQAELVPIAKIADGLGIQEDEIEFYGRYKAKLNEKLYQRMQNRTDGKLILVTAINPTPAGEGKTTTTVGLGQAMKRIGKNAIIALREPSLGPVFGVKGGAAGGGYAQVLPMEDINLHFTGDMHAITSANNLLCAMLDNHMQQGNELGIDPRQILIRRCLDMNDRALRNIVIGLGGRINGVPREDGFIITVASEVMAILCMASDMADLKRRLGDILVAYTYGGEPVYARDLQADGAMAALLRDAIQPNLVQTLEGTPAVMHGGPFRGGRRASQSVSLVDLAPTLLDLAGLPTPEQMDGHSFAGMAQRDIPGWDEDLLIQISESEVARALRTPQYKYCVTAPQKNPWLDSASDLYVEECLYDLKKDPYELHNLVDDPAYRQVKAELRAKLLEKIRASGEAEPTILPLEK